jgi:ATP-binding cassette subfamily B protein
VTFAYEDGRPVIDGFSATINKGENVVFTGRTGAGKTTLMKLTSGLLHPDSGQVLVNGIDIGGVASPQKRRLMGYVEQSFSFVSGTIFEQISLDDEKITREDVTRAVRFVGLEEYFKEMPQGLETQAAPELFSQGQRQLLAIARAIVTDPPVLLLDEVTANLDSVTEERVVDVLKRAEKGRTIISIAHRQSTINSADRRIEL